jgi:hypothetical protein
MKILQTLEELFSSLIPLTTFKIKWLPHYNIIYQTSHFMNVISKIIKQLLLDL